MTTKNKIPIDRDYMRSRSQAGMYGRQAGSPALAFVFWCTLIVIGLLIFGLVTASELG